MRAAAGRAVPPRMPAGTGLPQPGPRSAGPAAAPAGVPGNAAPGAFLPDPPLDTGKPVEAIAPAGARRAADLSI